MWPANPIDPQIAMMAAAERYAFYAALLSISLIVASIAVFLFVRNDLRSSALAAATLCVHPLWTVTDAWYDNGATLRLASNIWICVGCVAISAALLAVYRHGANTRGCLNGRFTCRSLLMLAVIVAIILVLVRPPLADEIPVSKSLPALGLMVMLIIALRPSETRHRDERATGIEIPLLLDRDRD